MYVSSPVSLYVGLSLSQILPLMAGDVSLVAKPLQMVDST